MPSGLDLFKVASQKGITVQPFHTDDLDSEIEGCYMVYKRRPFIFYLASLEKDIPRLRCVLAEEIGHHLSNFGKGIVETHFSYRDRLYVVKEENKALRWAVDYLLPIDKVLAAIRSGLKYLWELAEYFCVTEEMVRLRLEILSRMRIR
jgi:Zn-dependent peptidase ImmA (M78 family)